MNSEEKLSLTELKRWLKELQDRVDQVEKELRLIASESLPGEEVGSISIEGGFMELIDVLDGLSSREEVEPEGIDINALLDLLIRFFFRQEAQNTQIKLLILSQNYPVSGELFDEISIFLNDVEEERYTIRQLKFRWRQIERLVRREMMRLQKSGKSL